MYILQTEENKFQRWLNRLISKLAIKVKINLNKKKWGKFKLIFKF